MWKLWTRKKIFTLVAFEVRWAHGIRSWSDRRSIETMIMTSLDLVVVVAIAPAAVAQHHPIAARPSPLLAVPLDAVLRLRMIGEAMMRRRVVPRVPVLALDVPPPAEAIV